MKNLRHYNQEFFNVYGILWDCLKGQWMIKGILQEDTMDATETIWQELNNLTSCLTSFKP